MRWELLLIALIIAISGCASVSRGGFSISLQADPPSVFSGSFTTLHIDLDNAQDKSIRNVMVELFDTGFLRGEKCGKAFPRMLPFEFQSIACTVVAPKIQDTTESEVNVRASFESDLSATQVFEIINQDEYERRLATRYEIAARSYSYQDKNVMMEIEFSDNPPFVARPGKEYFVYFTIRNVGNGFVSSIKPDDFAIVPVARNPNSVLDCPALRTGVMLYPSGNAFPKIACKVVQRGPVDGMESADFVATLSYRYEVRDKLRINIIK